MSQIRICETSVCADTSEILPDNHFILHSGEVPEFHRAYDFEDE